MADRSSCSLWHRTQVSTRMRSCLSPTDLLLPLLFGQVWDESFPLCLSSLRPCLLAHHYCWCGALIYLLLSDHGHKDDNRLLFDLDGCLSCFVIDMLPIDKRQEELIHQLLIVILFVSRLIGQSLL